MARIRGCAASSSISARASSSSPRCGVARGIVGVDRHGPQQPGVQLDGLHREPGGFQVAAHLHGALDAHGLGGVQGVRDADRERRRRGNPGACGCPSPGPAGAPARAGILAGPAPSLPGARIGAGGQGIAHPSTLTGSPAVAAGHRRSTPWVRGSRCGPEIYPELSVSPGSCVSIWYEHMRTPADGPGRSCRSVRDVTRAERLPMDYHRTTVHEVLPDGHGFQGGRCARDTQLNGHTGPARHGRRRLPRGQRAHPDGHQHGDRRQGGSREAGADGAAGPGPPAAGGRPRRRQDPAGQDPGPHHRLFGQPDPVHPGPAALRCHRRLHLQPVVPALRVPARRGVRQHRDRRRNQPRLRQDAVGPAGVHGGAPGHGGRQVLQAGRAVHGGGHAESHRDGGDVPAARRPSGTVSWPGSPWATRTRTPRWRCWRPTRRRPRWPA